VKRRIFVLFLAVLLLGSLIPLAAAAKNQDLFEGKYELTVGMEATHNDTPGIYPESVSIGILPGDNTTRTYRFYVELYDHDAEVEAPQETYTNFWNTYDIRAYLQTGKGDTHTETDLALTTEGYRKYVECSFTGPFEGQIRWDATEKSNSGTIRYNTGQDIRILTAQQLTPDENGNAAFELTNPERYQDYFYYIDLGKTEAYEITGSLSNNAVGNMDVSDECTLYWRDDNGNGNTNDYSGAGRYIMLRVSSRHKLTAAETYTLTGTVNVEVEQPSIRFRHMNWDQNNNLYLDPENPLLPLSELDLSLGNAVFVKLYYGTSLENTPAETVEITDSNAASLVKETDRDGAAYWVIQGDELGDYELTITAGNQTYTKTLSVALPDHAFYSEQKRDGAHYLNSINLANLSDHTVWLMNETGYTAAELNAMTVLIRDEPVSGSSLTRVPRIDTTDRYDLKIVLPKVKRFTEGYNLQIKQNGRFMANGWVYLGAESQSVVAGDYTVGFSWYDENSEITLINDENWRCGNGTTGDETNTYVHMRTVQIAAGIRKQDEEGHAYYEIDKQGKVDLEIQKVWVEPLFGYDNLFSLSEDPYMDEKTGYTDSNIDVYFRKGCPGAAMIWAEVDVTPKNGKTETVQVSTVFFIHKATIIDLKRDTNDTVEKLNDDLQNMANDLIPGGDYTVYLAPIDYEGTIRIPSVFDSDVEGYSLTLQGAKDGVTVLNGSIDLNQATVSCINDISFHGSDSATRATYGGAFLNMYDCSFEGYDVAVDATGYSATVSARNVFVNNGIAARLDVGNARGGMNMNPWTYNTFINNETAVQMISFNDFISPYYFRVVHSNFINNKTDFDLQAPVTVYMYRNYYGRYLPQQGIRPTPGKYAADRNNGREDLHLAELLAATTETKLNKVISSYAARIEKGRGARVVSNPRWKYPVLDWWQRSNITIEDSIFGPSPVMLLALEPAAEAEAEATYENMLISDWELETAILNEEAENLQLSAEAFTAEGEKEIEVLDQDETVLGTWTFD